MARLIQVGGDARIDSFEGDVEAISVGRDRSRNDVVVSDGSVSRRHARIFRDGSAWAIEDLGSRNRTLVNGDTIDRRRLDDGDRIQIGNVALLFRADAGDGISVEGRIERPRTPSVASTRVRSLELDTADLAELRKDHENLYALYRVGKSINEEIEDTTGLIERIVRTAVAELGAERGFVALSEEGGRALAEPVVAMDREGRFLDDIEIPTAICREVFEHRRAVLTEDALHDPPFAGSRSIAEAGVLSALCVPLRFRGAVLGVLYLDHRARKGSFGARDLEFAACIADLAGIAIGNADLYGKLRAEMHDLTARLGREVEMIGTSDAFRDVVEQVAVVAPSDMTVLVTGESGTGKELVARAVHRESPRRDGPFVALNCAAIPDTLIESELFGYAPNSGISGAAPGGKPGRFELAHGGTIFLDEIGDMRLDVQATILRVLQDRRVERLGGTESIEVDVRVVAATNHDLEVATKEGRFREDLFYRVNRFGIHLPPLRERPEDIEPLAEHFARRHARSKSVPRFSAKARSLLRRHSWPGNIRELESAIERALLFSGRTIGPEALPPAVRRSESGLRSLAEVHEEHVRRVLDATGHVVAEAARVLGISRKTLHEKIKAYGIEREGKR